MQQLADDVWQLSGFPPNAVNVYLVGDVLIDAGMRLDRGRILKQVDGWRVSAHALTHAHPDHYGASHAVCEHLGIPLWCGAEDAEAVEHGKMVWKGGRMIPGPAAHPVARRLQRGRRGRRLHRAGDARPLPRPRLLLARVRPHAAVRRRDVGLATRSCCAARSASRSGSSRPTPRSTASRPAASPRSSRRSSASATGRRCATRRSSRPRSRSCRAEARGPMEAEIQVSAYGGRTARTLHGDATSTETEASHLGECNG